MRVCDPLLIRCNIYLALVPNSDSPPTQVLEVRDARVPLSSACNKLDPLLINRKHLIVLNKSDMLGPEDKKRWREYFLSRYALVRTMPPTEMKLFDVPGRREDPTLTSPTQYLSSPWTQESAHALHRCHKY